MAHTNKATSITSLKGDHAFQRLRKGQAGHGKYLSVRVLPSRELGVRVGIVVSAKVGKAVIRNRVRRRLKEAFRLLLQQEPLQAKYVRQNNPAFDVVIVTRPEAAEASYWQLRGALGHTLRKAGVFQDASSEPSKNHKEHKKKL